MREIAKNGKTSAHHHPTNNPKKEESILKNVQRIPVFSPKKNNRNPLQNKTVHCENRSQPGR